MAHPEAKEDSGAATEQPLDATRWVAAHGDALFGFALARLRVRAEAEDAVQETFLAALAAQARYRGEADERAWLFGILKHKVVDRLRRRSRELPLEPGEPTDVSLEQAFDDAGRWRSRPQRWPRPDEDVENEAFWDVLAHCLDDLPATLATTFRLAELDGLDTEETCKVLAISPTNAWVRLHRARLRLRECLERRWFGAGGKKRRNAK